MRLLSAGFILTLLRALSFANSNPIVDLGYGLWQATFNVSHRGLVADSQLMYIEGNWTVLQLQQYQIRSTPSRQFTLCSTSATIVDQQNSQ